MWAIIAFAVVAWLVAAFTVMEHRKEVAAQRSWFQEQLEDGRHREQQLLDQIQLNAQHLPYYPQVGPFPPVEEKTYLHSEDGLISFEDIDAALAEVER